MDEHQRGSCALMSPSIREHLVSRKGVNEGVKFEGQLLHGGMYTFLIVSTSFRSGI